MRHLLAALMLCAVAFLVLTGTAEAKGRHHGYHHRHVHHAKPIHHRRARHVRHRAGRTRVAAVSGGEQTMLPHPAGCPARAFCGCGAAVEVFGRPIRELWLASNWFRFPPAAPAPGMVAVRRHHVFVIREVRGSGMVLAYDANSGRHGTRLHLRSLSGYSVRNPHGGRMAFAG